MTKKYIHYRIVGGLEESDHEKAVFLIAQLMDLGLKIYKMD